MDTLIGVLERRVCDWERMAARERALAECAMPYQRGLFFGRAETCDEAAGDLRGVIKVLSNREESR